MHVIANSLCHFTHNTLLYNTQLHDQLSRSIPVQSLVSRTIDEEEMESMPYGIDVSANTNSLFLKKSNRAIEIGLNGQILTLKIHLTFQKLSLTLTDSD